MVFTPEEVAAALCIHTFQEPAELVSAYRQYASYTDTDLQSGSGGEVVDRAIREYCRLLHFDSSDTNREEGQFVDTRFSDTIWYLRTLIEEELETLDLKRLRFVLWVNSFLLLPILTYFNQNSHPPKRNSLVKKIAQTLSVSPLQLNAMLDISYYENQLLLNYNEGIINKKFEPVYRLIDALERGNGLLGPHHVESLLRCLHVLNEDVFVKHLSSLKAPHQIALAIQWMDEEKLIKIAVHPELSGIWQISELIRQMVEQNRGIRQNEYNTAVVTSIESLLIQLVTGDLEFFSSLCLYFKYHLIFNVALGSVAACQSEEWLTKFASDYIPLEKFATFNPQNSTLLQSFLQTAASNLQTILLSQVFQNWENFLNRSLNDPEFYMAFVELGNVTDYIVEYFKRCKNLEERYRYWQDSVSEILEVEYNWYSTISHRKTAFLSSFNKVYLSSLSLIDANQSLHDDVKNFFARLRDNSIWCSRYLADSSTFNTSGLNLIDGLLQQIVEC